MGCSPGWGFKERDYKAASYLLKEKSEMGLSIYIHVYMYIYTGYILETLEGNISTDIFIG